MIKPTTINGIDYYYDITQGTDEWLRVKHGVLSASTLKQVITAKTLKLSKAESTKIFYYDILGQRIDPTLYPTYQSYDMMRGHEDEPYAVQQYEKEYGAECTYCGFVVNNKLGFPLGWSPDALVGTKGAIEIKSRSVKYQIQTILHHIAGQSDDQIPSEYMMQVQTALYVGDLDWIDFISFCNGNQMVTIRVEAIPKFQEVIENAAIHFEATLQNYMKLYQKSLSDPRLSQTPRRKIETEITV